MKKKREINEENSVIICIITLIYRNDIEKSLVIYTIIIYTNYKNNYSAYRSIFLTSSLPSLSPSAFIETIPSPGMFDKIAHRILDISLFYRQFSSYVIPIRIICIKFNFQAWSCDQ